MVNLLLIAFLIYVDVCSKLPVSATAEANDDKAYLMLNDLIDEFAFCLLLLLLSSSFVVENVCRIVARSIRFVKLKINKKREQNY